ncbi:phosphatidylglycerol lysyltransferase domain-containing protein [Aliiroseovarius sp. S1339]|uniref:phosphatidylglycerol lysyltransferase domain-containing protein n=1 Tax=Aliiroseovarius sp. S1339 TaxID=2936990 RepID=UPI0020BE4221|nr:phosphatidylglycerol lysyltransferase domain-containing protein [Aliiroseovarius sp. S1339]MCK8462385.1 phosphatidylglycerol lysyltransferase domain-containing protein [Aliiroseovarius sp. S1339]
MMQKPTNTGNENSKPLPRAQSPFADRDGLSQTGQGGPHARPNMAQVLTWPAENGLNLRKAALRQLLPIILMFGLIVLMWDKIAQLDVAHIQASLKTVAPWQWFAAAGFTAVSFWALGRYDGVVHRLLGSCVTDTQAERAGITAIAISQTVGMGVISSALVRWRMLPDVSFAQAARISVIVTASFLTAWAVVTAMVVVVISVALPWDGLATRIAWIVLAAAGVMAIASVLRPKFLSHVYLPPLRAVLAFLMLALLDMAAAGTALWVLLPDGCEVSLVVLIAAYMLALGVGLVSGTPGGMGGFEITLLATLPQIGQEPLLAAILAFRAVYYALPAGMAALLTIRGPKVLKRATQPQRDLRLSRLPKHPLPTKLTLSLHTAPRAEVGLLRHGRLSLIEAGDGTPLAIGSACGQSLIMVSDPIDTNMRLETTLAQLSTLAGRCFRAPFLYKIGGRLACAARRAGWCVLPIAREAWLNPQCFTLDGSNKRQLRRKLRHADSAGVVVQNAGARLPLREMEQIATRWAQARGGERGFSMGVWDPATLPFAQVFLAYYHGRLIGFLTLHANANEHALDLMRVDTSAPGGTMQALVTTAIAAAKEQGLTRLSLAAVPLGEQADEPLIFRKARLAIDAASGADGLRQFKSAFAPHWETLYAAAPGSTTLTLGALDVVREIHRPQ